MSLNSAPNLHYPHAIRFQSISNPPTPNNGIFLIENVSADRNYGLTKHKSSSGFAPCFIGVDSVSPEISWTSKELDLAFSYFIAEEAAAAGTTQNITRPVNSGDAELWYRAGKQFSFREAATATEHIVATMEDNGMLYWDSLEATPDIATISMRLMAAYATVGTDLLQIQNNAVDLPVQDCDNLYKLERVLINGTIIKGVQSVSWNNGVQPVSRISAGDIGPSYIGIDMFEPVVTITSDDLDQSVLSSEGGDALSGAGLEIYLRRKSRTNFHTAGTLQHIKLSALTGVKVVPSMSGSPATNDIVCHLEEGAPTVVVATGVTIPGIPSV